MAKQLTITEKDLVTTAEAAEQLGVCKAQVCKYVRTGMLRRVKDRTDKCRSYIYAPDVQVFLESRFYFEESNDK